MTPEIAKQDVDKVEKVILSCKNKQQLKAAFKLYTLWKKKYEFFLDRPVPQSAFSYRDGKMVGIFTEKLNQYK